MQPTVEDLRLLKRIYVGGQSVHVEVTSISGHISA